MTPVNTDDAREFSNDGDSYTGAEVRVWVHNLADEVDRLREVIRQITLCERHRGTLLLDTEDLAELEAVLQQGAPKP